MKSKITFIIPCYGKKEGFVKQNVEKILKAINFTCEVIFVYKNSEMFNYDTIVLYLKNKYNNFSAIKFNRNVERTAKIKAAIQHLQTEYFQVIDCHHQVDKENLSKFICALDQIKDEYNFIVNSKYVLNFDDGLLEYNNRRYFNRNFSNDKWTDNEIKWGNLGLIAGNNLLKSEVAKQACNQIPYDIVFCDDVTWPLFYIIYLLNNSLELKLKQIDIPYYIVAFGKEVSTTSIRMINGEIFEELYLIFDSASQILRADNDYGLRSFLEAIKKEISSRKGIIKIYEYIPSI